MGSGKSSVGRAAASLLRLPFVDTDQLVENATGRSISQIFAESGEEAFRKAETLALQRLLILPDSVVATGGGAVLRLENWDYMQATGLVIRLMVSPEESLRRTSSDTSRPLLAGENRLERLRQLHKERDPWYARAHRVVHGDQGSVLDLAHAVVAYYEEWLGQAR